MLRMIFALSLLAIATGFCSAQTSSSAEPISSDPQLPNIVIIFVDDLGYADIGPFGATTYKTPNLDAMATRGRKFADFVTSSAVCSASRAALLTGCNHRRVGISGALFPKSKTGINSEEMTLSLIHI